MIKLEKTSIWLIPILLLWLLNSMAYVAEGRWLNVKLQEKIKQVRINYSIPVVLVS